jgi:hypothetical protein
MNMCTPDKGNVCVAHIRSGTNHKKRVIIFQVCSVCTGTM